jgi:hypothetical protein
MSSLHSDDGTGSLKVGATPSMILDYKEFSSTEGFFFVSDFTVDGSDSFCAYYSRAAALGAQLRSSCLVMSNCGDPIYPSNSK